MYPRKQVSCRSELLTPALMILGCVGACVLARVLCVMTG